MSATSTMTAIRFRQNRRRVLDAALFVWGTAAAANLIVSGANDARRSTDWPRGLELVYVSSLLIAVVALAAAAWARASLRRLGAAVEDERTISTTRHASAFALTGALAVQVPYLLGTDTVSSAQAKFTVAAALVTYGASRLWLGRTA